MPVQTYNAPSSTTFTVPADVTSLDSQLWGTGETGNTLGGRGSHYLGFTLAVTPGENLTIAISASSGGSAEIIRASDPGQNALARSITSHNFFVGVTNQVQMASGSYGEGGFNAGEGGGGGSGAGGTTAVGAAGQNQAGGIGGAGGAGGAVGGGAGGTGGNVGLAGGNGTAPGGGGGGAGFGGAPEGVGGAGRIVITYAAGGVTGKIASSSITGGKISIGL